jgi:hypothetical protein
MRSTCTTVPHALHNFRCAPMHSFLGRVKIFRRNTRSHSALLEQTGIWSGEQKPPPVTVIGEGLSGFGNSLPDSGLAKLAAAVLS